jgi:Na+/melibiose symporter-like transporter
MYLTPNQTERDSATGYRMFFEIFGVFLAAVIQGGMITIYGSMYSCESINNEMNMTYNTYNQSTVFTTTIKPGYNKLVDNFFYFLDKFIEIYLYLKGEGYLISAGIMCIIYFFCSSATFFGTIEIRGSFFCLFL